MKRKQKIELGNIFESLVSLIVQESIIAPYTLTHAVDEYLAFLGGDSAATTYMGVSTEMGTPEIERLKLLKERLATLIEEVGDA